MGLDVRNRYLFSTSICGEHLRWFSAYFKRYLLKDPAIEIMLSYRPIPQTNDDVEATQAATTVQTLLHQSWGFSLQCPRTNRKPTNQGGTSDSRNGKTYKPFTCKYLFVIPVVTESDVLLLFHDPVLYLQHDVLRQEEACCKQKLIHNFF